MKIVTIGFEDSIDISVLLKGTPVTVSDGTNTIEGKLLALIDAYEKPTVLVLHTHTTGLPLPPP